MKVDHNFSDGDETHFCCNCISNKKKIKIPVTGYAARRCWCHISEFAIRHVVPHGNVKSIQNPSTVTNPTILPLTLPCMPYNVTNCKLTIMTCITLYRYGYRELGVAKRVRRGLA